MLDILIRGGQVVTPKACGVYDVGIAGEKIVAVEKDGALSCLLYTSDAADE